MWLWNQLETHNKQQLYSRLDPGGQVHFVTYAINSRLYMFGICCFAVEMRFQFFDSPTRKEVSGRKCWEGPSEERGEPGSSAVSEALGSRALLTCWLLSHTGHVCWFGLFLIHFIMIKYTLHNVYQFNHKLIYNPVALSTFHSVV